MAHQKFFEDEDIAQQALEVQTVPDELLAATPLAEDKFVLKSGAGKFEKLHVKLYPAILAVAKADGSIRYLNLSFMRADYEIEDNSSMKYRIKLMKFNETTSLYTDKLERVQEWMGKLSKFCINYTFFKKYTICDLIGEGAFGKVYKVSLNADPSQTYAAKVFDKKSVKRMHKKLMVAEIQVLQMMHHENIVKIEEVHEAPDEVIVVMELMNCGLLSDFMRNTPKMSGAVIRQIMLQLLRGLAYMASIKVIHRDIKPNNILIEKFEKTGNEKYPILKIADLGLACFEGEKQLFEAAGTPGYMAPEVILNGKVSDSQEPLTSKLDVYSAGVLFYWLITKRSPFKQSESSDTMKANEIGKVTFDSMYITKFCKYGVDLLKKMLDPRPKFRIGAKDALDHPYFCDDNGSTMSNEKRSAAGDSMSHSPHHSLMTPKNANPQNESGFFSKLQIKKCRSKSFN